MDASPMIYDGSDTLITIVPPCLFELYPLPASVPSEKSYECKTNSNYVTMRRIPILRKMSGIKKIDAYEGETIENKVRRITENKEPIKDAAPLTYTQKKMVYYLNIT